MKKLMIIAALAGLSVATQAQEQKSKTPEERAQMRTERLAKQLDLSPEQVAQVQAINLKYIDKTDELRKERQAEHAETREAGKAMRGSHEAEMKAVLTPEQYTKWMAAKEKVKARQTEKAGEPQEK